MNSSPSVVFSFFFTYTVEGEPYKSFTFYLLTLKLLGFQPLVSCLGFPHEMIKRFTLVSFKYSSGFIFYI